MSEKYKSAISMSCNQVIMSGIVDSPPICCSIVLGERFYSMDLNVQRKSGRVDRIPILISEKLMDVKADMMGMYMEIIGSFRSFNRYEGGKNRLILSVYVQRLQKLKSLKSDTEPVNSIFLDGFLCKAPYFRKTPGGRRITELMMSVKRNELRDYIPCICWGENAFKAKDFEPGDRLKLWGRVQSRIYQKRYQGNTGEISENRTAYEISVGRIELAL